MVELKRVRDKCKGAGIVKDKNGVNVCFDCLENDVFEQHGKPKDSGIKW